MVTAKDVTGSVDDLPGVKKTAAKAKPLPAENDPISELKAATAKMREATEKVTGGKVLLKMERDNVSFTTDGGVKFSKDHPYQLVDKDEVDLLLRQDFRVAWPEEMEAFYDSK